MIRPLALVGAALCLTACDQTAGPPTGVATPTAAEQACLRDVTATANTEDVVLLGSEPSEAGTAVRVGVGSDRAPWICVGFPNGTTAGLESLTDEGAL